MITATIGLSARLHSNGLINPRTLGHRETVDCEHRIEDYFTDRVLERKGISVAIKRRLYIYFTKSAYGPVYQSSAVGIFGVGNYFDSFSLNKEECDGDGFCSELVLNLIFG